MKKGWIMVGAAAVIVGAVFVGSMQTPADVQVETVILKPRRVEQTVSCMGAVEAADGHGVCIPVSCFVSEIKVREGQRVKAGDVVAVIDREATRRMLSSSAELVALAALEDSITAAEDGVIVSVGAQAGQVLEAGIPCAVVAYDRDIQVRIAIREKDLRVLRKGMSVRVSGEGLQQSSYEGTLTEIASAARTDLSGGTVVEGVVTIRDGRVDSSFRLGLTAKAAVVTSVTEEGLVIPYDAVISDEHGSFVYIAEKGEAHRYSLNHHLLVPEGVLLLDRSLENAAVIVNPDGITDGCAVVEREASA